MSGSPRSYAHVARSVLGTPWFIRETEGTLISALIRGRVAGERLVPEEIEARIAAARETHGPRAGAPGAGPVAIVPVYGVLFPRASMVAEMSGGSSVAELRASFEEVLSNREVAAVIAEFDSPGGSVDGIEELATWLRDQRGQKPMVAVANTMACSAAYYLAAQFDEIVASPSSITGSIGVYNDHIELSGANEAAGIKPTRIRAPATKGDINDAEPLSDEARAHLQSLVDDYYGQFVTAVARGRGVSPNAVREGYGQGRELTAARAKAAGLVDRVDTLENTARRLASGRGRAAMAPAALSGTALRRSLDVVEAAFRGGYVLPPTQGGEPRHV